ncbi:hypothetical protein SAMN02194393_03346 [Maledivibacter halophilus]|uniref:Uncharacterized protein n=2 Tax=Maledivibacter halophilus TaxID=36842 RepID=A0A1T5LV34_9FIRM|nr:hypothetical protein SAMN02194393_03346 [Maledivibacter halophilus]
MVINMNRVERKKIKRESRMKRAKRFFLRLFSFVFLIVLLYIGLEIVDETNRGMMSMGDTSFFSYNKFDDKNIELIFCGDKYLVNTEKIEILVADIIEITEYGINNLKRFAKDKGEVVTKLIDSVINSTKSK